MVSLLFASNKNNKIGVDVGKTAQSQATCGETT